jgi:asparaginyl-tRNA synthetase
MGKICQSTLFIHIFLFLQSPVFVTHYPKSIKPFYMKPSSSDSVFAFDLLLPEVCEIAGGSQRIDSIESLESSLHTHKLDHQVYSWYVDLRRYGSVPHSGFGLGFDRLLLYATGLQNIRDVVPIPRSPGSLFL